MMGQKGLSEKVILEQKHGREGVRNAERAEYSKKEQHKQRFSGRKELAIVRH